jgi:hypothetical protein
VCVLFSILSYSLSFILSDLRASILTKDRRKQKKGNKGQRERPEQEDTTRGDEQHRGDLEMQREANEQKETRK